MRLTLPSTAAPIGALLALAYPGVAASASAEISFQTASSIQAAPEADGICSGQDTGRLVLRVFRPARTYRIPPTVEMLHKEGDKYFMPRDSAVWKAVADRLCADLQNRKAHADRNIGRRIIIFLEGSYPSKVLSLEFPDLLLNRKELLKGRIGQDNVQVHADDIRILLDHAFEDVG